ncbi:cyclophane-forming radical SAM/SPASM peptide maturase XyeB [Biostraticola tofi]|uniref:Radical SAM core domain-containing protein n=1 Tax=Biostraticola tofi TaxID=466109 RepID=A0A4R3YI69_9GAMM|nr:uncharacterized protein EDC52_11411 [Biostraticola tofi]
MGLEQKKENIEHLEIVLKISERCNLNCDYCYVFNKGNSAAEDSPARINKNNVRHLVTFLHKASQQYNIKTLKIDFHGGEPLLMNKRHFADMCECLLKGHYQGSKLMLALQTNGILIDEEWIALFECYSVSVNISLDGPKYINDRHRLDHQGRSSYLQTVSGLQKLQKAHRQGRLPFSPGILSVANPQADGAEIYRHFVDVLGVTHFDFLLPDDCYKDTAILPFEIGRFLNDALNEWIKDDDPHIAVRLFNSHIASLLGNMNEGFLGHTPNVYGVYAFTVGSDGLIRVDDTLRSTSDDIFNPIGHISCLGLSDVLHDVKFKEYAQLALSLPVECEQCIWKNVCAGGRLVNRFSTDQRFQRKSVYCYSMRMLLSRISAHLLDMGVKESRIIKAIGQ